MGNSASSSSNRRYYEDGNDPNQGNNRNDNTNNSNESNRRSSQRQGAIRQRRNQSRINPLESTIPGSRINSSIRSTYGTSSSTSATHTPRFLRHLRRMSRNAASSSSSALPNERENQNINDTLSQQAEDPLSRALPIFGPIGDDDDMVMDDTDMFDVHPNIPHPFGGNTGDLPERLLSQVMQEILSGIMHRNSTESNTSNTIPTETTQPDTNGSNPTTAREASITFLMAMPGSEGGLSGPATNLTDVFDSIPHSNERSASPSLERSSTTQERTHTNPFLSFVRNMTRQARSSTRQTDDGFPEAVRLPGSMPTENSDSDDTDQTRSRVVTVFIIRPIAESEDGSTININTNGQSSSSEQSAPQSQEGPENLSQAGGESQHSNTDTQSASLFAALLQALLRQGSMVPPPPPTQDASTGTDEPNNPSSNNQSSQTQTNSGTNRPHNASIPLPLQMLLPLLAGDGPRDGSDYDALTQLAAFLGNVRPNTANEADLMEQLPEYTFSSGTLVIKKESADALHSTDNREADSSNDNTAAPVNSLNNNPNPGGSYCNHDHKIITPIGGTGDKCTICLAPYEEGETLRLLPCSHAFHKDCLDEWLVTYKNSCPLCRSECVRNTNTNQPQADGPTTLPNFPQAGLPFGDFPAGSVVMFVTARL